MMTDRNDMPIIKTFFLDGKYFMYDPFSNGLFEVSEILYTELKKLQKVGFADYINLKEKTNQYNDIIMLIRKGVIRKSCIERIQHPETDYISSLVNRCFNDITLQVTRKCNFNCCYCMFTNTNEIGRNHEQLNMSLDTARRSIDFLYDHSLDATTVTIGFYGGEPLMNFDLIKATVEYAEKRFFTKKILFRMTINGSLLTNPIVEFLVEHDFIIVISLDGPEFIQNKHRKFEDSGNGTFNTVFHNVIKMREKFHKYFQENVSFSPVVIEGEDSKEVLKFFESIEIPQHYVKLMDADLSGIDYISNNMLREKEEDDDDPLNETLYERMLKMYNEKSMIREKWHHSGQCIPSIKSLFVNVYGDFYPCEKVIEYKDLSIGNIESGLNIQKITEFLNVGKLTEEECKRCWAMRFCDICIGQCIDVEHEKISLEAKLNSCERQKQNALHFLKKYIKKRDYMLVER